MTKIIRKFFIISSVLATLFYVETSLAVRKGYNVYSRPGKKNSIFTNTRNYRFSYTGKSKGSYRQVRYKSGGRTRYGWVIRRAITSSDIRRVGRRSKGTPASSKVKFAVPSDYKLKNNFRVRTGPSLSAKVDGREPSKNYKLTGFQSKDGKWLEAKCKGCRSSRWIYNKALEVTERPPEKSDRIIDDVAPVGGEVTSPEGQHAQVPLPTRKTEADDKAAGKELEEEKAKEKESKPKKDKAKKSTKKRSASAAHLTRVCKRVLKKWRGKNWRRSMRYCYRGVKKCLQAAGLVPDYLPGRHAKNAGPHLLKRGFKKLNTRDPRKAPAGAVIVYKNKNPFVYRKNKKGKTIKVQTSGHIDIKGSDRKYYSDYQQKVPGTDWGRIVTGIYLK